MEYKPLVSVIMNCYNSQTYLKEAIESVLAQTYTNFELIFWDNQSTDQSAKIVKFYEDIRIKYFYADRHTSLGEARNLAIEKCKGEWIAFIDCDDLWHREKLEMSLKKMTVNINDNIALIYSKSLIIDQNGKTLSKNTKTLSGNIYNELLIYGDFIIFSSILIKRDVLNEIGKINSTLHYCEDYDLLLKVCKYYDVIGIDEYLTYYRKHDKNITSTKLYENDTEVVKLLETQIESFDLQSYIAFQVYLNNSYRLGSLIFKLLLRKEFANIKSVLKFHRGKYLYLFPLAIVKIKLIDTIMNSGNLYKIAKIYNK